MADQLQEKLNRLKRILTECGSAAVAFSGGVDSTFLLHAAHEALPDKTIAVTVAAPYFPMRETAEAADFCRTEGIRQIVREFDGLAIEGFAQNPPDRCYICKKELFGMIGEVAAENGIDIVMEGSNTDDDNDYRPGHRAIRELGIRSPLREAGLSKDEIRALSRAMKLPTWDKPSFACLASRFPYGQTISREKLQMVEQGEQLLLNLGFSQMRVRIHEDLTGQMTARIELPQEDMQKLMSPEISGQVSEQLKAYGFSYVALDLRAYRTGRLNESIPKEMREKGKGADL